MNVRLSRSPVWRRTVFWSYLIFGLALSVDGCSLPKIIVLKDPLAPEEHLQLGAAYERNGELDAAIKEYGLAAPKIPLATLYLGNAYFRKNELDRAERSYREAIEREPGHADAYNNLAWLYYTKQENLEEAEELALMALERNPEKREIYQDTLDKIRALRPPRPSQGR